jgi:hypothetical protein
VVNGERHTLRIELILEIADASWLWTEEFIWHKKNCYRVNGPTGSGTPGKLLQFNKSKKFKNVSGCSHGSQRENGKNQIKTH